MSFFLSDKDKRIFLIMSLFKIYREFPIILDLR